METAAIIVLAAEIWAWAGLGVGLAFLAWGVDRVEPNARGAYLFRPLILPGIVLLWPLVLWRWAVLEAGRDRWQARHAPPRGLHAPLWRGLALLIPAILLAGLLLRQSGPAERAPVLLEPPRPVGAAE
ncbi:MAG: hypothetical protein AAF713_00005 [Pseudomonadota bacterium]